MPAPSTTAERSPFALGLLVALSGPIGHAAAQEGVVAQEQIEEGESVLPAGEAIALDEVLVPLPNGAPKRRPACPATTRRRVAVPTR